MHRERVSENVYWFQSEVYAQVTAGVVVGPQWAVAIDTLPIPEETLDMRDFIERNLNIPIRYVINTHYHADHSWGNCFFPHATIIAHRKCRRLLEERGIPSLERAKQRNPLLDRVEIVLPHITLEEGELTLRIGKKHLRILPTPGHSEDGISVLVVEDKILFAGDAFMSIPYIVDGDYDTLVATTKRISHLKLENIIRGHGDIILRGEIEPAIKENLAYLSAIKKAAKTATRRRAPFDYLESVDVEKCGKSRVCLGGLAESLHQRNLRALYLKIKEEMEAEKK
jgi:glyoxylase-like metal-dependent hydrolase (beta-lactamase superfamily II)